MVRPNEHRECLIQVFDEDGIVEGVEDCFIAHTVLSCALGDLWLIHKLPCLDRSVQVNLRSRSSGSHRVSVRTGARSSAGLSPWTASRHCPVKDTAGSLRSAAGPTSNRVLA